MLHCVIFLLLVPLRDLFFFSTLFWNILSVLKEEQTNEMHKLIFH